MMLNFILSGICGFATGGLTGRPILGIIVFLIFFGMLAWEQHSHPHDDDDDLGGGKPA